MPRDFFPARDTELANWCAAFAGTLSADPIAFGVPVDRAAEFWQAVGRFAERLATASNPLSRTAVAVGAKNTARAEMIAVLRGVVRLVQASATVTDERRAVLGLPTAKPRARRAAGPTAPPAVVIESVNGRSVRVHLSALGSIGIARPTDARGALVFMATGENRPDDPAAWAFAANTVRTTVDVDFSHTLPPGTQVWITACWYGSLAQNSPMAHPVHTFLSGNITRLAG